MLPQKKLEREEVDNPIPALFRESKYHSKTLRQVSWLVPFSSAFPYYLYSDIMLINFTELTVARQPMIYTWFPITSFYRTS